MADEAVAQLDKALDEVYDWCILNHPTPHLEKSELVQRGQWRQSTLALMP